MQVPASNLLNAQPLMLLASRFHANCQALAQRNESLADQLLQFRPTSEHFIAAQNGQIVLIRQEPGALAAIIPDPVPPTSARQVCLSIFRDGTCTESVAVIGPGYGWLWNTLYTAPTPDNFRPPLFFLIRHLHDLHVILHVHDWAALLADTRVHLFAGDDAIEQFRTALLNGPRLALPRLALDIDASLRRDGESHQDFVNAISAARDTQRQRYETQLTASYAWATPEALARKIHSGQPLRVLGLASRRTTFLQHSMRDWLQSFARLGHDVNLLIEETGSEILDQLSCLKTTAEFQPDLLLLMNHTRAEAPWLPREPIAVTWLQDDMPNVLSAGAGARQGNRDFLVGYGRQECIHQFGYPAARFMSARIGVNEERFAPSAPSAAELERFGCDVSYVSHAGLPADAHLQQCIADAREPQTAQLLRDVFDRLRAIYEAGGSISEATFLRHHVDASAATLKIALPEQAMANVARRLFQTVNQALFRHQPLEWLADAGVQLHLYGNAWETHPRLRRFARGVADNQTDLRAIYQSSRINLQIMPQGAVHQRLCDGLAAGGFFLLRYCAADVTGPMFQSLSRWCLENRITDDAELRRLATPEIRQQFDRLGWLVPDADAPPERACLQTLARSAQDDFARFANSIWPAGADMVANVYRPLWEWCRASGVQSDDDIRRLAPPDIRALLPQVGYFFEDERRGRDHYIVTFLRDHAEEGYDRFAASVWPEYHRVVFNDRDQLLQRVKHYLQNEPERREIAASMRKVVLDKFTYRAITERLLLMIGKELGTRDLARAA